MTASEKIQHYSQFARTDLWKVEAALNCKESTHVGLLFNHMHDALSWACSTWLHLQGHDPSGISWNDMEARFLRLAPTGLQDNYLTMGQQTNDLEAAFYTLVGQGPRDGTSHWLLSAPSLSVWRLDALRWHENASALVEHMLQTPGTDAPAKDTAPPLLTRGLVRGRLDGLTPAWLLLRPADDDKGTMFDFVQHPLRGFAQAQGFLLPLALCRDDALRAQLQELVRLQRAPLGAALAHRPTLEQRRQSLHAWLANNGLGYLRCINDPGGVPGWTQWALTPAVFDRMLRHFDYASALYDTPFDTPLEATCDTAPTNVCVAQRQPFAFANHGALLAWAGLEAVCQSTYVFRLFLLDEAPPACTPSLGRDTLRWERPDSYWADALRNPHSDIRVQLQQPPQEHGVIALHLHLGSKPVAIELQYYRTNLLELLDWLHSQEQQQLPTELTIEDDDRDTRLIVHPNPLPTTQALPRLLVAAIHHEFEDTVTLAAALVDAQAYFSAWKQAWRDLLAQGLDMPRWCMTTEEPPQDGSDESDKSNIDAPSPIPPWQVQWQALRTHPFFN